MNSLPKWEASYFFLSNADERYRPRENVATFPEERHFPRTIVYALECTGDVCACQGWCMGWGIMDRNTD